MIDANKRFDLMVDETEYDDVIDWACLPPPESVIVHSEEELWERLEKSHKSYLEGRTINAFEMIRILSEKYGI